jgi:hypothetical protein
MIRNKWFVLLWPLTLPLSVPLLILLASIFDGRDGFSLLALDSWRGILENWIRLYQEALFPGGREWYVRPMVIYVFIMLLLSLVCWFRKPCTPSLLGTMLAGWVLCGLPGIYLLVASICVMPGDSWMIPAGEVGAEHYAPPPRPWGWLIIPSLYLLYPLMLALESKTAGAGNGATQGTPDRISGS